MSSTRKYRSTRQPQKPSRERLVPAPETQEPYILIGSLPKSPPDVDSRDSCRNGDRHDPKSTTHPRQQLESASLTRKTVNSRVKKTTKSERLAACNQTHRRDSGGWDIIGNGHDVDDAGDGSDSGYDRGAGPSGAQSSPKPLFACPFYKLDSMQYMSCMRLRLSRIRDVKQHLHRRHRRPIHCPTCGCIFADTKRSDDHIRERACVRPPGGFHIEGVTESQSVTLGRRVNRSLSETRQWFSIWEILFPGSFRPTTPYLSNYVQETIQMMYDYWQRHGETLVAQVTDPTSSSCVGGSGNSSSSSSNSNSNVASASFMVVETLLSRFRSSSQDAMSPALCHPVAAEPAPSASPASEPMPPAEPVSPPELTQLPHPAHSRLQQSGSNRSNSSTTRHNTFAAGNNTDPSTALMFSPPGCTPSAAPNHSPYSMDTMYESSPYSQLDVSIDFLPVHASLGPLASAATLDSQQQVLILPGAWLDTDPGADSGHGDQIPMEQDSTQSPTNWLENWQLGSYESYKPFDPFAGMDSTNPIVL